MNIGKIKEFLKSGCKRGEVEEEVLKKDGAMSLEQKALKLL